MYDLAIRGGDVVGTSGIRRCDVYVTDGRIATLSDATCPFESSMSVDATGLHVLPGAIDGHTHFRTYSKHCDNFAEMARSAAHGGVTTVLAFILGMNATERPLRDRVIEFIAEAKDNSAVNYGFHVGLADEPGALEDVRFAIDQGITSFKMFMAYRQRSLMVRDDFMLKAMTLIGKLGGLAMVHAEAGDIIDALGERVPETLSNPAFFEATRPSWTEAEAARRAVRLAAEANCPVYFVHISSEEALEVLLEARAAGQKLFIETCPQYLNLTHQIVEKYGALAKVAPPLRYTHDVQALRLGVLNGDIDVVASDHAPYTVEDKIKKGAFADAPFGAPGTETLVISTVHAILEEGGYIQDAVRVLCDSPSRIFGISEHKGRIEVGTDADMTLVDLNTFMEVDGNKQHSNAGYSLYHGLRVPMSVKSSFIRGMCVLDSGSLLTERTGKYLSRSLVGGLVR